MKPQTASFQAGSDDFWRAEDGRYILSVKEVIDEGLDPQHYYAGVALARRSHQRSLDASPPVVAGGLDEY